MTDRIWLKNYPANIPPEIDADPTFVVCHVRPAKKHSALPLIIG